MWRDCENCGGGEVRERGAKGWVSVEGGAVLLISHIDTYHLNFQCLPYSRVSCDKCVR